MIYCPYIIDEYGELPETEIGGQVKRRCPKGTTGDFMLNTCNRDGTWSEPDLRNCSGITCKDDNYYGIYWPVTNAGEGSTQRCPSGSGSIIRSCDATGNWVNVSNTCVSKCPSQLYMNINWEETNPYTTVNKECPYGYANS